MKHAAQPSDKVRALLFDLGGVLIVRMAWQSIGCAA
jgi:hypothetical protein